MKKRARFLISVMLVIVMAASIFPFSVFATDSTDNTLQFHDGKFRILIIADPQDKTNPCEETLALMNASIEAANPDLVVFTGDNIHGSSYALYGSKSRTEKAIRQIMEPVTSRNIPFAIVYGNHDDEGKVSKEFQMSVYQSMPGCLSVEGEDMTGCGNYNLTIKNSEGTKNVFNLWFIDSGTYDEVNGGYAHVAEDQIAWYEKTSNELKAENDGTPMPSMLFQHIPVPEIYDLLTEVPEGTEGAIQKNGKTYVLNTEIASGHLGEGPCSAQVNGGQFSSWEKQGDIVAAFFGHDHVNDFVGTYNGIDMGYTPGAGFYIYGNGLEHATRVVDIDESTLSYSTSLLYYKDVVGTEVSNKDVLYSGQYVHNLKIWIPIFIFFIAVLIAVVIVLIVKKVRKKHGKKAKTSKKATE